MGGRALQKYGVFTERKNTDEFKQIGYELAQIVSSDFNTICEVVTCYHTKETHGDLDLLVMVDHNSNINWKNYIEFTFKPNAIYCNGGVYSFDYKNFQVDIIPIINTKWETAKIYFSYDPLGNIMGKTYHKFGLSYGWQGLFYKFRNFKGSNSHDILLSNDARKIFEFGGYDYDRYLQGFDTLEDIFKFCIAGKYFDTVMFQMENLNSIDKKRNRKRGSYHLFLNYLKDNEINVSYPFNRNKSDYVDIISQYFPEANLTGELDRLNKIDARNKMISQKFNGDIVMSWLPDLRGGELGAAISKFKNALDDDYNDFILNSSYEAIKNRFMLIYYER
jgi:hypothetical protein